MAPPSTRELNVKVIFVVTTVAVLLMVAIVYAAQAGFFYFQNRQTDRQYEIGAERTYQETGLRMDNLELARLKKQQLDELRRSGTEPVTDAEGQEIGTVTYRPIDEAMDAIADRY
ncbi:MAG: hypothetical protein AAFX76_08800 [Planctomycetota bacterium]